MIPKWGSLQGQYASSDVFNYSVTNTTSADLSVTLDAISLGLDARTASIPLRTVTSKAHTTTTYSLSYGSLPIQSMGTQASVQIEAKYSVAGDKVVRLVPSQPTFYEFSSQYAKVTIYGATGKPTPSVDPSVNFSPQPDGSLYVDPKRFLSVIATAAQPADTLVGRVWTNGKFTDVTTLPPQGAAGITTKGTMALSPAYSAIFRSIYGNLTAKNPAPPLSPTVKICSTWQGKFIDGGLGEDFANTSAEQNISASFARAVITSSDGTAVWKGVLDANGCTSIPLLVGSFTLWQDSYLNNGSSPIDITYGPLTQSICYTAIATKPCIIVQQSGVTLGLAFDVTGPLAPTVIFHSWWLDQVTSAAFVVTRVLQTSDNGLLPGGGLRVVTDEKCDGSTDPLAATACFESTTGVLYLGPNNDTTRNTQYKYVAAHEFGHGVNFAASGFAGPRAYGGSGDTGRPALCACAHVSDPSDRSHCLQSRETDGTGQTEGWAHFYAAKIWVSPAPAPFFL